MMPPPALTPLPPPLEGAPLVFTLTPLRLTLVGPAATFCPTLRSRLPLSARRSNSRCKQRAIALHFDIDIVFERERDHILRRNVKVARADERVEARRIRQVDGWNISLPDTGESASRVYPSRGRFELKSGRSRNRRQGRQREAEQNSGRSHS